MPTAKLRNNVVLPAHVAFAVFLILASLVFDCAKAPEVDPQSLSAYRLREKEREVLAAWEKQRGAPDSLRAWVQQHHTPLQAIGLRLSEQATLFRWQGKDSLATAKLDTAQRLGQMLAEVTTDTFLLRQIEFIKRLDAKRLQKRGRASVAYANASDLLQAGKIAEAEKACQRAYDLAKRAGDDKIQIDAAVSLLWLLGDRGDYQLVVTQGEETIQNAERVGYNRRLALTLDQVATAYLRLGNNPAAQATMEKAIRTSEKLKDREALARCYHTRATIYKTMGAYQRAEQDLQKLIEIDEEKKWRGLANLQQGYIDLVRGEYDRAQGRYEEALSFFQKSDPTGANVAVVLNGLSSLYLLTGDYEAALTLENEALALRESTGNLNEVAASLSRIGFIYSQLDSLDQAIVKLREALQAFTSDTTHNAGATSLSLGEVFLKKGNWDAAKEAFDKAEHIAGATNNQILKIETQIMQGRLALSREQPTPAKTLFEAALEMARPINEPSLMAAAYWGLSQAEGKLFRFDRAMGNVNEAIAIVENLRAGIGQDTTRVSYFATVQQIFDEGILLALARNNDNLALDYAEHARARALLDALPREQQAIATAAVPKSLMLKESIPQSVQVIEYRITSDTLLIWLIDSQTLLCRRVPISSKEIERNVYAFLQSIGAVENDAFRARAEHQGEAVYEENRQLGRQLCQLLIDPFAEAISPRKTLFILPDGVLHHVPLGALVRPDGRFFDECYLWVKAPSLSILTKNLRHRKRLAEDKQSTFLMLGGDLPSVRSQKRLVKNLFPNSLVLETKEATFEALNFHLQTEKEIVYFSVHAVADARYPMNSYIELYADSGANGKALATPVYARQLLALDFSKTWMVILNACETASGKITRGEGMLNLVRVFSLAHVPVVVASLWKNDDRLSARIMNDFFTNLAEGEGPALALHHAKITAIQNFNNAAEAPLPYFWAVFEIYKNAWDIYP